MLLRKNLLPVLFLLLVQFCKSAVQCGSFMRKQPRIQSSNTAENTFPCDSFLCMLEKFEVLKGANSGQLLLRQYSDAEKIQHDNACSDFRCWLRKYRISKKSYGFELSLTDNTDNTAVVGKNTNTDFSMFRSKTTTTTTSTTTSTTTEPPETPPPKMVIYDGDLKNDPQEDLYSLFY